MRSKPRSQETSLGVIMFENSVTCNKCDHNIYMLFQKLNNISKKLIDMNILFKKYMSYHKIMCSLILSKKSYVA